MDKVYKIKVEKDWIYKTKFEMHRVYKANGEKDWVYKTHFEIDRVYKTTSEKDWVYKSKGWNTFFTLIAQKIQKELAQRCSTEPRLPSGTKAIMRALQKTSSSSRKAVVVAIE